MLCTLLHFERLIKQKTTDHWHKRIIGSFFVCDTNIVPVVRSLPAQNCIVPIVQSLQTENCIIVPVVQSLQAENI